MLQEKDKIEIYQQSGYDPKLFNLWIDPAGRIVMINQKTTRKTVIGVMTPDGKPRITKKATKSGYQYDRKCINFYVPSDVYYEIVQTAILSGKNISQYCRDAVLDAIEQQKIAAAEAQLTTKRAD